MHDSGIKVLVQDRLFQPKKRIQSGLNLFRFAPTEPAEFSLSSATCSKEWLLTRLGGQNYLAFWRPGRQTSSIVWGLLMVGKKVLCGSPGLNSTIQAKVPHSFAWALTPTPPEPREEDLLPVLPHTERLSGRAAGRHLRATGGAPALAQTALRAFGSA